MKINNVFLWALVAFSGFGPVFAAPKKPLATVNRSVVAQGTVHAATFFYEQDAKVVSLSKVEPRFFAVLPSDDAFSSFVSSKRHTAFSALPSWNPLFRLMTQIASSVELFKSSAEVKAQLQARIEFKDSKKAFFITCDLAKSDLAKKPLKTSAVITVFGASAKPFVPLVNLLQAVVCADAPPFRHWGKVYAATFIAALAEVARLVVGLDEPRRVAALASVSDELKKHPELQPYQDGLNWCAKALITPTAREAGVVNGSISTLLSGWNGVLELLLDLGVNKGTVANLRIGERAPITRKFKRKAYRYLFYSQNAAALPAFDKNARAVFAALCAKTDPTEKANELEQFLVEIEHCIVDVKALEVLFEGKTYNHVYSDSGCYDEFYKLIDCYGYLLWVTQLGCYHSSPVALDGAVDFKNSLHRLYTEVCGVLNREAQLLDALTTKRTFTPVVAPSAAGASQTPGSVLTPAQPAPSLAHSAALHPPVDTSVAPILNEPPPPVEAVVFHQTAIPNDPLTGKPQNMDKVMTPVDLRWWHIFELRSSDDVDRFSRDVNAFYASLGGDKEKCKSFLRALDRLLGDVDSLMKCSDALGNYGAYKIIPGRDRDRNRENAWDEIKNFVSPLASKIFYILDNYGHILAVSNKTDTNAQLKIWGLEQLKITLEGFRVKCYEGLKPHLSSGELDEFKQHILPVTRRLLRIDPRKISNGLWNWYAAHQCSFSQESLERFTDYAKRTRSVLRDERPKEKFLQEIKQLMRDVVVINELLAGGGLDGERKSWIGAACCQIESGYGNVIGIDLRGLGGIVSKPFLDVLYNLYTQVSSDLGQTLLGQDALLADLKKTLQPSIFNGVAAAAVSTAVGAGCGAGSGMGGSGGAGSGVGAGCGAGSGAGAGQVSHVRRAPLEPQTSSLAAKVTTAFCKKLSDSRKMHVCVTSVIQLSERLRKINDEIQCVDLSAQEGFAIFTSGNINMISNKSLSGHQVLYDTVGSFLSPFSVDVAVVFILDENDLSENVTKKDGAKISLCDGLVSRNLSRYENLKIVIIARDVAAPSSDFNSLKGCYGKFVCRISGNDVNAMADEVYSFVCPRSGK